MRLIIGHTKPDFDALASIALARLVHPGAVATVMGSLEERIEAFIHLYRDRLELTDVSDIDPGGVEELIIVDTCDPGRVAPFEGLIGKVPITLYDHHPRGDETIPAAKGRHQRVGATATILTLMLAARDLPISPELASLALLGIHEDTGHLSYGLTRAEDYEAAAFLMRSGASLDVVEEFSKERYDPEHRDLFARLLTSVEETSLHGYSLVTATLTCDTYLSGISPLCNSLLEMHGADAALLGVRMEGKTLLIARAKGGSVDVGAAFAEALGGGGHPGAAFAKSDLSLQEAKEWALEAFTRHSRPGKRARDLMSQPVKTVRAGASVAEAQEMLANYGHNGLPVLDSGGRLVGIISRRDLERARRHGLGRSKVRGFMTRGVITASVETSQRELERLVQEHNIGRIPILKEDTLVGIVTRTDLIAARHSETRSFGDPSQQQARRVLEGLPSAALTLLETAKERLEGGALYLVGGTVRDALLTTGMQDLDLVVEGVVAERLGAALQGEFGGSLSCHFDFGTCTLELPNGLIVDIATAREEFYRHPGALPTVTPSTLRKDLSRRDFTVNALALRLHPEPPTLLDPYSGLEDLEARVLRSLHPLSFVEDPTRAVRGARLAGRLGFTFHEEMFAQIEVALEPSILEKISKSRLRGELLLTLSEIRVTPALALLERTGALGAMFGMRADKGVLTALDEARAQNDVPDESYLLVLLTSIPDAEIEAHREAFGWPRRLLEARRALQETVRKGEVMERTLTGSGDAFREAVKAFGEPFRSGVEAFERAPQRKKLRGQDVLDLGLPSGPEVGEVLAAVERARTEGSVTTFEEELKLAERLVTRALAKPNP